METLLKMGWARQALLLSCVLLFTSCDQKKLGFGLFAESTTYPGCAEVKALSSTEAGVRYLFVDGMTQIDILRNGNIVFTSRDTTSTDYIDKDLVPQDSYEYECRAVIKGQEAPTASKTSLTMPDASLGYVGCRSASAIDFTSISVHFDYPPNASKVTIYRNGSAIYTALSGDDSEFLDESLTTGKTYRYTCEAQLGATRLTGSNRVSVSLPDPSESLGNFLGCSAATPLGASSIRVSYQFPSNVEKMTISRDGIDVFSSISKVASAYVDNGLIEGQSYTYSCSALVGGKVVTGSNVLTVSTLSSNPPVFGGITTASAMSASSIKLTWGVSTGVPIEKHKIYLSLGNSIDWTAGAYAEVAPGNLETTISGLGDQMIYTVGVRACAASGICSANTQSITVITPDGGAPKTLGPASAMLVNGQIQITYPWQSRDGGIFKRRIYRKTGSTGGTTLSNYTLVKTQDVTNVTAPPTVINISDVAANTQYFFVGVDEDSNGNVTPVANPISINIGRLNPPAFSGLTSLSVGPTGQEESTVRMAFTAIENDTNDPTSGASYYSVFMVTGASTDACANGILKEEFPVNTYTVGQSVTRTLSGLAPRTTYSICLKARDSNGNYSTTTAYFARRTLDKNPPIFDGIQGLSYNNAQARMEVLWNASNSPDILEYKVTIWKNTPTPATPTTLTRSHASFATGFNFTASDFAFTDNDTIYVFVNACDDAGAIPGGTQNCTSLATPVIVTTPDVTPPASFLGIKAASDAMFTTPSEGTIQVPWYEPVSWAGYRGFKIYYVDASNQLSIAADCPCPASPCALPSSTVTKCSVSGLDAFRSYKFHVRAYDAAGNLTTYLNPVTSNAIKRASDTTPPSFSSNLALNISGGVQLSWTLASDNQYAAEPGAVVTYTAYRKTASTFTDPTNPAADGALLTSTTSTSFTDVTGVEGVTYFYTICASDASNNTTCDGNVKSKVVPDITPPVIGSLTHNRASGATTWNLTWTIADNFTPTQQVLVTVRRKNGSSASDFPTTSDVSSTSGLGLATLVSETGTNGAFINYLIVARDSSGNESTRTISIANDQTIPVVTAVSSAVQESDFRDVTISVTADDAGPGPAKGITSLTIAEAVTTTCAMTINPKVVAWTASTANYTYRVSNVAGDKNICVKAVDSSGLSSQFSASGVGTEGADRVEVGYTGGGNPPILTSFNLTSNVSGSTTTFALTESLTISYSLSSAAGFSANPVDSIEFSLDRYSWTILPGTTPSSYGTATPGVKTWSGSYAPLLSPSGSYFWMRLTVRDINDQIIKYQQIFNIGKTSVVLGMPDDRTDGQTSKSVMELNSSGIPPLVRSSRTGDIYYTSENFGLRRIHGVTGIVTTVFPRNVGLLGNYPYHLIEGNDYKIYLMSNGRMLRFDPAASVPTLEIYFGGGGDVGAAVTNPNNLFLCGYSPFDHDNSDNMYLVTSANCANDGTTPRYLYKVTRNGDQPGTVSLLAGNGVSSAAVPSIGSAALTSPLPVTYLMHLQVSVNGDGSLIYFGGPLSEVLGLRKYVNGIWQASLTNYNTHIAYNPLAQLGRVFYAYNNNAVKNFAPNLTGSETLYDVHVGTSTTCHEDGVASNLICPEVARLAFSGNRLYTMERAIFNAGNTGPRIKTTVKGKSRTILGGISPLGLGGPGWLVKTSSLNMGGIDSQKNLFIADNTYSRILKVAADGTSSNYAGNGGWNTKINYGSDRTAIQLGTGYTLGMLYVSVDPQGNVWWRSQSMLCFIKVSDEKAYCIGTSGGTWETTSSGQTFASSGFTSTSFNHFGLAFDTTGRLYGGAGYNGNTFSAPKIIRVNDPTSLIVAPTLTQIAGARTGVNGVDSNASSPDGSFAATSTIKCSADGLWGSGKTCSTMWIQVVGSRIYFGEIDRIRYIDALDGTGTLQTLRDGSGNIVTDLGTPIDKFKISGNRLYFLRGGYLRCRWLGTAATMPGDCNLSAITLPFGPTADFMDVDDQGSLYLRSSNMVFKYTP